MRPSWVLMLIAGLAVPAAAAETITYSYDARGRIITVAHNGTVNDGIVTQYTLDKADNRVLVTTTGATAAFIIVPLMGGSIIPTRS